MYFSAFFAELWQLIGNVLGGAARNCRTTTDGGANSNPDGGG